MSSSVKQIIKKFKLKCLYIWIHIKKYMEKWISYSIMFMCVMLFILALGTNIAHRLPVLSFFAKEMKMPYLLDVYGEVCIFDREEEIFIPIKISIGGYLINTKSGEQYEIRFSAVEKDDIPVVIKFVYEEEEYTMIEYLNYSEKYNLTCEYKYILGE